MEEQFQGIQVQGTGKMSLVPNVAYVTGGVVTEGENSKKVITENSAKMAKILGALESLGIPSKDIQTSRLNTQPVWGGGTKTKRAQITGYVANNTVTVTIKDMDRVSEVMEVMAMANNIESVDFAAEYPEKELEVLGIAVKNAETRAKQIAASSGVKLGSLISCVEQAAYRSNSRAKSFGFCGVASAESSGPQVNAGEIEMQVNVTTVYAVAI